MGRMAFGMLDKLRFMPRDTLKWRLEEWLAVGCESFLRWEVEKEEEEESSPMSLFQDLPILIVAGEDDQTLPSISEAQRLSTVFPDVAVHVVPGA